MQRKDDCLYLEGTVSQTHKGGLFTVLLQNNTTVFCKTCGKMTKNLVKVLIGDQVLIELSVYDLTKGRIVQRIKGGF